MTNEQKLDELIKEIEKKDKARGLSDEYLRKHHYMTREELGIGEYSYGIIMIPTDFVLDYLKELQEQQEEMKKKDKQIDLIKEYTHQEIVHYTETIKDYEDDDKKENKYYIEELKEKREHWKDIEKILQNKKKEELYMNWWKYGLYE